MVSSSLVNRRSAFILGGAVGLTSLMSPAQASLRNSLPLPASPKSYSEWYELLDFVPENATIKELEEIFPDTFNGRGHRAYRNFVARHAQGYRGRSQVAFYLSQVTAQSTRGMHTQALPFIVIHVGRIALQTALRVGGGFYSTLRMIVKGGVYQGKRGYAAFNQFMNNHPFFGNIVAGVSATAVYDWLRGNMP